MKRSEPWGGEWKRIFQAEGTAYIRPPEVGSDLNKEGIVGE